VSESPFAFVRRKRYDEAVKVAHDLYGLLVQHHAVNEMQKIKLVGGYCPVCVKGETHRLDEIVRRMA